MHIRLRKIYVWFKFGQNKVRDLNSRAIIYFYKTCIKGTFYGNRVEYQIVEDPKACFLRTFITSLEPVFVKNKTYFGCFGQH